MQHFFQQMYPVILVKIWPPPLLSSESAGMRLYEYIFIQTFFTQLHPTIGHFIQKINKSLPYSGVLVEGD